MAFTRYAGLGARETYRIFLKVLRALFVSQSKKEKKRAWDIPFEVRAKILFPRMNETFDRGVVETLDATILEKKKN